MADLLKGHTFRPKPKGYRKAPHQHLTLTRKRWEDRGQAVSWWADKQDGRWREGWTQLSNIYRVKETKDSYRPAREPN